jgi:hypothetical protein
MAISPKVKYPAQIIISDPGYPLGKARNVVTAGDGSGTPWEADLVNDVFGFQQALLDAGGVTASGNPDKVGASNYLTAIQNMIAAAVASLKNTIETGTHTLSNMGFVGTNGGDNLVLLNNGRMAFNGDFAAAFYPLDGLMHYGRTISEIAVEVKPGAARSGTSRMRLGLTKRPVFSNTTDWSAMIAAQFDDGTATEQSIVCTPTEVIDTTINSYALWLIAGNNASTAIDSLMGASITLT